VLSGLVASSQTDVTVDLAALTATFVDSDGEPDVDPATLLAGPENPRARLALGIARRAGRSRPR
jgi:hypothetical protein